jgi:hypothetical protein
MLAAGRFPEGLEALRKAHRQDERNSALQRALLDVMVERAQTVLETDWRAAETLLREALELDPGHNLAKSLRALIQERKREEFIQLCVAQARRAQARGDIGGAFAQVQEGLTSSILVAAGPSAGVAVPEAPTATVPPSPTPVMLPRRPAPPQPRPPTSRPAPPPAVSARPQAGKKTFWIATGAAVLVVTVLAALFVLRLLKKQPATEVASSSSTAIPAANPTPAPPQLAGLRVYTDLENGKVALDGNEIGTLEGGQFSLDNLSDGQHSLEISDGTEQAKISVLSAHDSMPLIQGPLEAKNLKAIAVTNGPQQGQVVASYGPLPASMDGREIGALSSVPLGLPNLLPGTHDLVVGTGKDERKVSFQVGTTPALTIFLSADRNVGNLLVLAGEDGATVLLNGRKYPRTTKHGQLVIANLEPKRYTVSVFKEGFQPAASQEVNVQKGQGAKLVFVLQPAPIVASLVIAGATPLAEVLLDGKPLGTIQEDGSFSASNIKPGPHTIALKKDLFKPKELQRQFVAGESVHLNANEVALESAAPARPSPVLAPKLIVQTVPGALVSIDGQAFGQTGPNGRLEISQAPAGEHTVEVVAKPYNNFKEKVTLSPGLVSTITPSLLASMPVEHKHLVGSCNGTLIVGQGKVQYQASNAKDSFNYPLTSVKKAGAADSGKGFYLEIAGAKRYVFHAPAAAEDLQIILNAMPKQ